MHTSVSASIELTPEQLHQLETEIQDTYIFTPDDLKTPAARRLAELGLTDKAIRQEKCCRIRQFLELINGQIVSRSFACEHLYHNSPSCAKSRREAAFKANEHLLGLDDARPFAFMDLFYCGPYVEDPQKQRKELKNLKQVVNRHVSKALKTERGANVGVLIFYVPAYRWLKWSDDSTLAQIGYNVRILWYGDPSMGKEVYESLLTYTKLECPPEDCAFKEFPVASTSEGLTEFKMQVESLFMDMSYIPTDPKLSADCEAIFCGENGDHSFLKKGIFFGAKPEEPMSNISVSSEGMTDMSDGSSAPDFDDSSSYSNNSKLSKKMYHTTLEGKKIPVTRLTVPLLDVEHESQIPPDSWRPAPGWGPEGPPKVR